MNEEIQEQEEAIADRMETPHGALYRPRPMWIQIPLLIAAFFAGPCFGGAIGGLLGGVSENAQIFLYIPYALVFFVGYALWQARLQALAFDLLGRSLLKALFILIVKRRKPEDLTEVIPSKEKLLRAMVRAQKAANSFWIVAIPIGMLSGAAATLIESDAGALASGASVGGGCVPWGWALGLLARRGYLPFAEGE